MPPPSYRQRLRAEGLTLAATGGVAATWIVATRREAMRKPVSTVAQLALVGAGLARYGPRVTLRSLAAARPVAQVELGSGAPVPLWLVPAPLLAVTLLGARGVLSPLPLPRRDGEAWDRGLRAAVGGALLGLYQAMVAERFVCRSERAGDRTYYRLPAPGAGGGTVLGYVEA